MHQCMNKAVHGDFECKFFMPLFSMPFVTYLEEALVCTNATYDIITLLQPTKVILQFGNCFI